MEAHFHDRLALTKDRVGRFPHEKKGCLLCPGGAQYTMGGKNEHQGARGGRCAHCFKQGKKGYPKKPNCRCLRGTFSLKPRQAKALSPRSGYSRDETKVTASVRKGSTKNLGTREKSKTEGLTSAGIAAEGKAPLRHLPGEGFFEGH